MKIRSEVINAELQRAGSLWILLRFVQRAATVGAGVAGGFLLLEAAMLRGLIASPKAAWAWAIVLIVLAVLGFGFAVLNSVLRPPARDSLAASLERVDGRLMDRLNTLVFLERVPDTLEGKEFASRIVQQTKDVLKKKQSRPVPFPVKGPLVRVAASVCLISAWIWLHQAYSPWNRLVWAGPEAKEDGSGTEKTDEFTIPSTNAVEQPTQWGEVRITDPGSDLKVTKVDVVPLQIEAAANEGLQEVSWRWTVNGLAETTNSLPPPTEPRYAIYKPMLYLDELRLSDWDVVTYYGKARTIRESSYASPLYFLEVRPFREEILKLPGGEGGQAYQRLNELTALIEEQQKIIRATHQFVQEQSMESRLREQDGKKLAAAENDLAQTAEHLYASMAAEMENKPISEALDSLAKAEKTLSEAGQLLGRDMIPEAQNRERKALAELAAARKMFQKAVTENPEQFEEHSPDEIPLIADDAAKLRQMAEFRNETKAAQEFVKKTERQQEDLAKRARTAPKMMYPKLGEDERQLSKSLQEFQGEHPQQFKKSETEFNQAQEAMKKAAENLQKRQPGAPPSLDKAQEELKNLSAAMEQGSGAEGIQEAYQLKEMLDRQIQTFSKAEQAPASIPTDRLRDTASAARQTVDRLQELAQQSPTREQFGQPLRDALSPENKAKMDLQLGRLERAREDLAKRAFSRESKELLSEVSKAFDQSQPKGMQAARQKDSLKTGGQESMDRGMAELGSLIQRLERNRNVPPAAQKKQLGEAASNLKEGMPEQWASNPEAVQTVAELERLRKGELPVDLEVLKKLAQQLQRFSMQATEQATKKDPLEITHIDPNKLPPAYRGRIQNYFQKLSEK